MNKLQCKSLIAGCFWCPLSIISTTKKCFKVWSCFSISHWVSGTSRLSHSIVVDVRNVRRTELLVDYISDSAYQQTVLHDVVGRPASFWCWVLFGGTEYWPRTAISIGVNSMWSFQSLYSDDTYLILMKIYFKSLDDINGFWFVFNFNNQRTFLFESNKLVQCFSVFSLPL